MRSSSCLVLLLLALAGCNATRTEPPGEPPAAAEPVAVATPDPLAERIHHRDGRARSRDELVQLMLKARVVYLGEKHDSERHHEIQRSLLDELVARGARPALGMEIFSRDQTGLLMGYVTWQPSPHMKNDAADAESWLRERLGWDDDSPREETWRLYGRLIEQARQHEVVTFGIDLPPPLRRRISRVGTAGLTHAERALLEPTGFEDAGYRALMLDRLKQAHCGFGSEEYLGRLYDNWVARNDAMARAIVAALEDAGASPVLVVLGAGHLEDGMGVPERVAALVPGITQVNLGLRELASEPHPLTDYLAPEVFDGRDFGPPHDYFWFTPSVASDVDHCADFHKTVGTPSASSD